MIHKYNIIYFNISIRAYLLPYIVYITKIIFLSQIKVIMYTKMKLVLPYSVYMMPKIFLSQNICHYVY
jgi:hypothetical protein